MMTKREKQLNEKEYEKLKEIYKIISSGKVMSIEDLPDEI